MAPNYKPSSRFLLVRDLLHTAVVFSMVLSWFVPPVSVAHAAEPATQQTPDVPAYITQFQADTAVAAETTAPEVKTALLPDWYTAVPDTPMSDPPKPPASSLGIQLLPEWFEAPLGQDDPLPEGPAACSPAEDLALQLTVPANTVSRGNVVGDVYTATITNNSTVSTTTEVSLLINPNQGFYYLDNSATVTSNISGTLPYTDEGTTVPDASFTLTVNGTLTETSLVPGETMTFTFVLATDATAQSAQPLAITLQSGNPPADTCLTTQENVQTARGNLTILKSPATQNGRFGEHITWTVTMANSGLGNIYDAIFTDTIGAGYTNLSVAPTPQFIDLAPEASQEYTVTAVIAACSNLTNTVAAEWSIGNTDGTALTSNPIENEVDISLLLEDPDISVTVPALDSAAYCGSIDITRTLTVANSGGAGTNLRLNVSTNLSLTSLDPDWNYSGGQLTYGGGVPAGTIRGGEVLTIPIRLQGGPYCGLNASASLSLTPASEDGCQLLTFSGSTGSSSSSNAPTAPTLDLTKSGPGTVAAGDTFNYDLTISGQNQETIGPGGIVVTDNLPNAVVVNAITPSLGTISQTGTTLIWTVPATATGAYAESLRINVTVPQEQAGACSAGSILSNSATAVADVCPECNLSDSAGITTYVDDYLGDNNRFSKSVTPVELCGNPALQQTEVTLDIQDGVDWDQTTYTDPLGQGQFALPLNVVPGSVNVEIDGIDRTGDITATLGPPLVLDFANVGTISATARVTITYQITAAAGSIMGNQSFQSAYIFSQVDLGSTSACDPGGSVGYVGSTVSLHRGDLGVGISPTTLTGCTESTITLNVTGGNAYVTDNTVVRFEADPTDIFTTTAGAVTYGGAFTGQSPTVVRDGNIVTFTFPTALDLNSNGTISFPLYRACGVSSPLSVELAYQDRCDIDRSANANVNQTLHPNVSLFVTPDRFTVNERVAPWRFYATNTGTGTAFNTTVTNTLPAGYFLSSYEITSTTTSAAELSAVTLITGTLPNGREIVTATIPSMAPSRRIQFDLVAGVDTCTPVSQVDVALFMPCGAVNGTCGARQTDNVTFIKGIPALVSSNIQPANLPLCETGSVKLVVKNASATADLYNFAMTDLITNATYIADTAVATVFNNGIVVNNSESTPLQNIPFTPTVQTNVGSQELSWSLASFTPGSLAHDILTQRDASDEIHITFDVLSSCDSQGAQVQSFGSAEDACTTPLSFTEDSLTLTTDEPDLSAAKTVRNISEGTAASGQTFAGVGDTLVWEIDVTNSGAQRVTNLFVDDQMPDGFTIQSVSPITSSQTSNPPFLRWHETGGQILNPSTTATYHITTTVDADVCSLDTTNEAQASYACSTTDICLSIPVTSTAQINTKPAFTINPADTTLDQCGGGPIRIDFPNSGARAESVILTYTLPAGLIYAGLAAGTTPAPDGQPALGTSGTLTFTYNVIGSQSPTNALLINVINQSGVCIPAGTTPGNTADLSYTDTCGQPFDDIAANSNTLTIVRSDISTASQTPLTRTVEYNQTYTWTITIPNTGNSATNNMIVTETLGVGWTNISASPASPSSTVPTINGNVITWNTDRLEAGQTWTAVFTATSIDAATDYRTTLNITTACDDGGCLQTSDNPTYNTPLQSFAKGIEQTPVAIGESFSYTITADFWGARQYINTIITDTLPTLNGTQVFSPTGVTFANENGGNTWTVGPLTDSALTFTTSAPATGQVDGPDFVTITITGLISNEINANANDIFTNNIVLNYIEDGQAYTYTDNITGTIREPLLAITKIADPTANLAAGDDITYTLTVSHLPASTAVAYDVIITDIIPAELTYKAASLDAPDASVVATSDQLITITYNSLTLGNTAVLTYVATADTAVNLSSSYTNTATVTYTSTPGDNPAERIGTGSNPDDHIDSDTSTIGIVGPTTAKALITTSLADTTGLNVAVGEIITYAVTLTMPQGTMPASILTDTLDAGLAFVSCSSIVPASDVTASAVFASACDNPTVTNQGRTVAFDFGTITNANLNATTAETIVVTYQAVVVNDTNTNRNSTHNNSVIWAWNNDSRTVNATNVTVVEPTLTVAKTVDPGIGDAADVFTFTLSVAHAGTSNAIAYDAVIADAIPTGMTYIPGSLAYVSGPSVITDAVGTALTITIPTLTQAQTSVVQFQATLNTAVRPGDIVTNTANLSWTSLPDDVTTAQSAYNPQSTERTGSTADPGSTANDHRASDNASVEMTSFADMTKNLTATSHSDTVTPNVAIGEILTYTVQLQVPEGTMNTAVLTDTLDTGLSIIDIITITAPVDVTTSLGTFADVLSTSRANLASPGQQAVYTFGTVVNTNTDNAAAEYIDVVYQAIVINSTANNRGDTRNNNATFTWDTGSDSDTTTNITIVEPTLNITKTAVPTTGDAGDTTTFTFVIDHAAASNSVAYDLVISDTIPTGMTYVPASLVDVSGTAATSLTHNAGLITAQWISLPTIETSTIQFQVTLDTAVQPGDTFTNAADLTWTSLPGDVTTAQSAYDVRSTERTGSTADPGLAANDYTTTDTSPIITMTNYPNVTKAIIGTNLANSTGLNVAIGEIITYQVAITMPEGTLNTALLTDTLPAGLAVVTVTNIIASPGLAASIGTFADVRAAANTALTNPGDEITFDFGNLSNSNTDNATAETITITYEAVVLNTTGNNRGNTRVNAVDFTWATGSDNAAASAVTIIEPTLNITKTPSPTSGDAGDTITYTLVIDHDTASNATAYDLVISDTIPADLTFVPGSLVNVSGTTATSLAHNAGLITAQWVSLPTTETSTIQFQVTLDTAVQPGDTFTNAADLTWTSLPGDVTTAQSAYDVRSTERTGSEADPGITTNDYATNDTAPVVTMTSYPVIDKIVAGTNLADSAGLNVAIGEIITYQVAITMPEGTLNTALLTDTLPAGLAAVSVTNIIASPGLATSIGTFADVRAAANTALTNPGDEITFDFGNLSNSNTDNATAETITITYEAVVLNTTGNNRGDTRVNAVDFTWATGSDSAAASTVTIIEPELTLTKTAVPTTGDAGDTITFTLVIDHVATSNSIAYNIVLTDAIPTGMTYVNSSFEDVSGTTATSLVENGGILTATWDTLTTAQVSTIRFRVTVDDSTQPGETIVNNARLSWTSLPGDSTTAQSSVNPASIERIGTGVAPDDHTTSASDSVTLNTPITIKLQPTPTQYTIGDTITYNFLVTLTEGTIQDMVVFDNLPAGLAYQSHTIITTTTAPDSLLTANYNGSVLSPTLTNSGSSGDDVTLDFGSITTTGDNDDTNNTYQVQITAVVLNETANQQGDTRTNSAELRYTDADGAPQTVNGGSVDVILIEPQITTIKTVTPTTGIEAGDTITYTVTFTNTGDSTAYDVTAVDTLAQGVNFGALDSCTSSGAISNDGATLSFDGNPAGSWDIAIDGSITCAYTTVAQPSLFLNGTHTNTIDADWSSQDGIINAQERDYTDTGTHDVDADQDVDTAVFSADAISFAKADSTATATLGDTVFYTLTMNAPLGTLRNLVIEDVLPAGLIYDGNQAVSGISTVPTVTVSTPNDGSASVTINWDFDDAVVTNNTTVLTYSATVANALSNQQGNTITNTARLTYNNAQNVPQTPLTDSENVTIIEPVLAITKTIATPATPPDAGGTTTYQIVVAQDASSDMAAYDVVISDTLPTAMVNARNVTVTANGITAPSSEAVSDVVRIPATADGTFDLPLGAVVTITFDADIDSSIFPNQLITNTAHAAWSTQDGTANANERTSGDGFLDDGSLNDYEVTAAVDFVASGSSIDKSLEATSASHTSGSNVTIGEIITYALTVNLPEGIVPALVITDNLPAGLAYTGDYVVDTTGFNGTITSGDPTVSPASAGVNGQDVVFTFSQPITVTADNDATNNTFTITLRALVLDVSGNVGVAPQTTLTNNATLQIGSNPPETSPDVTVTVIEPQLVIGKQFSSTAASTDDTITVTLAVTNTGTSNAYDVVISDPLSAYFTNITEATTATGFTYALVGNTVSYSDGTINVGQTVTFTFTAVLTTTVFDGLTIPNTVTVTQATTLPGTDTGERDEPDVQASDTLTVLAPDLAVTKDDGTTTTGPGDILTYTLTITNNGTYTATGIVLTDTIPLNTSLVDGGGAAVSDRDLTWNLSPLGAGDVVTRAVSVQVDDPLTFGVDTITNTTGVIDDGTHGVDPTPADNSDSDSDTPIAANLSLLKAVNDAAPNYGDVITFTLTLTNDGPDDATGVTVSDTLPTGLIYQSSDADAGSYNDATNIWSVGTIANATTAVLTITTQITATGAFTNTAWVQAADQYDPDSTPGNDDDTEDDQDDAVLDVPPAADLSLTKEINDDRANVGNTITYTLTLTNDGPDPASGVTVSDTLPAGLSFVTASSTPGTSYAGSTWTIGSLAVSAQVTLTIQATVDNNGVFDNVARVETANEYDIDSTPGNNVPTEDDQDNVVLDTPEIDLSMTKSVNDGSPNVGNTITYTLAVANAGPDTATGVTVSDTLPAGLTFITATTTSGSYNDTTGVWTIGAIAASGSASLQIAATVDSNGTFTNTAWVQTAVQFDTDSTPGDNDSGQDDQDDAIITTQEADLSLTKAVNDATPNYADIITYTLTLTNAGPDAATNVAVRDVLPTGLSYQNSSASQGSYDNGTSLWTVGTIANGTTAVLTLTAQVNATGAITNSARVETSDQYDPDSTPGNDVPGEDDQANVGITVPDAANLSLTKIVNDTAPNVGDTAVFTITLTNTGPDTATGVTVTDTLPTGLTYVTSNATVGSYDSSTDLWTVGAPLTSGSNATLVITVTINQSGSFTNIAQVQTTTEYDPDSTPGNDASGEDDQDSATLTTQLVDLSLTKTVTDTTPNLNDDVNFIITAVNDGPDTATGVTVSDTLPIGLVYQSSSADLGSYDSGTSIWNIGTLGNGATAVLTITTRVTTTSPVTNTAWVQTADQYDGDSTPGDNDSGQDDQASAGVTTEVIDLSLTKAVNPTTPDYGDTITYTLTLTNAGPSSATGVTISDTLPAALVYQNSNADLGSYDDGAGLWTVGSVNAGTTAVLTITAQVSATGSIINSAQVQTATEHDPDSTPGDDSTTDDDDDSVTITVGGSADLSLTKIVNKATPNVGDAVTFTVTLTNAGPNTATGVTVTDTLPAGLSYVGHTATPGTTYNSGTGLWNVGTLNVGTQVTLTLQASLTAAGTHTNVARVETSDQHDIDSTPGNDVGSEDDQDTAVVTTQQANLSLTKSLATPGPYALADIITYTIAITNAGPDTATGIAISETLPAGLAYQNHNASQGTYTSGGSWDVGTLALSASSTLTLVVQITDSGLLTNTAEISSADQFDPDSTPGDGSTTDDDDDRVTITVAEANTDLGDLPDSYGTLIASDGARHVISGLYLGGTVDAETDGQPTANADGDDSATSDDEDGIMRNPDFWVPNADVTLAITVTGGNGRLLGWVDWDGSGSVDASEATDFGQLAAGNHTVTLTVPADYTTGTALYARFRLFDSNNLPDGSLNAASGGLVSGGEVEDYFWTFGGATNITLQDFSATPGTAVALWWLWLLLPLSLAAFGWRRRQPNSR